ncbi:MAG: hypothetical protein MJK15_11975 [Colwellia sp.]|nr:hypothetical protein [Colwellia sp.]
MVSDTLGKPQIDTTELIRVFGAISKVSQKRIAKKSQNVAVKLSRKNNTINLTPNELEDIITRAVEKALSKAIPLLIEHKKTAPMAEEISEPTPEVMPKKIAELITSTAPVVYKKRKPIPVINRPFIAKKKERKNGYAAAFGLPNVITEVIHLQIMKLHSEGLTSREIEKKVSVSQASIQRTINVST